MQRTMLYHALTLTNQVNQAADIKDQTMTELLLFFGLLTKHFIIDFPLQGPYQYKNKGTYGHPGGLLHSAIHFVGTSLVFIWVTPYAFIYGIIDAFVHYHIDWAKMNLNKRYGWTATTHEQFWWLMGLDQYLHGLTYIILVFVYLY